MIVYSRSEDCAVEQNRMVEAGGKIQKPKTAIGEYGYMTLGLDSEGNIFGVHSMK